MIVVIDTNIVLSALRSPHSKLREIISSPHHKFFTPNFLIVEIFRHKERIIKKSKAGEEDVYELLNKMLRRIHFINEENISTQCFIKAYELCKDVDEKDTPFVALTLELGGKLWTRDNELKHGLIKKGFDRFF